LQEQLAIGLEAFERVAELFKQPFGHARIAPVRPDPCDDLALAGDTLPPGPDVILGRRQVLFQDLSVHGTINRQDTSVGCALDRTFFQPESQPCRAGGV